MSNIHEQKPDHHYRTEIPNIVLKLGLSPYDLLVYCHIKRIAGDDRACWRSISSFASECGLSERQVQKSIQVLKNPFAMLLNNALIISKERFKEDGSRDTNLIEIVDIWRFNGDYFRNMYKKTCGVNPAPGVVQSVNQGGVNCAPKEDPSQEDPIKEDPLSSCCSPLPPKQKAKVIEKAAAAAESKTPYNIKYVGMGGEPKTINKSRIYQHFIKFPYPTELIEEALSVAIQETGQIMNYCKFLESICSRLTYEKKNPKQEKVYEEIVPDTRPKVNLGKLVAEKMKLQAQK